MQQNPKPPEVKKWRPIQTEWGFQADVIKAMIKVLEERKDDPLRNLVAAIIENEVIHTSRVNILSVIKQFCRRKYGSVLDEVPDELLMDLRQQQEWLALHNNIPPRAPAWISPEIYKAIEERYGQKLKT